MGDGFVVGDFYAYTTRIGSHQKAEEILVTAIARAQDQQNEVFLHQLVGALGDEVETFLIGKA